MSVIEMINSVVLPNQKPKNLQPGELWATHSGVLKIGELEIRCHILSNKQRIFEKEDLDRLLGNMIFPNDI